MKYAIVYVGLKYLDDKDDTFDTHCLGLRDNIQEAEAYRDFVIREDKLNPNNVSVISFQEGQ